MILLVSGKIWIFWPKTWCVDCIFPFRTEKWTHLWVVWCLYGPKSPVQCESEPSVPPIWWQMCAAACTFRTPGGRSLGIRSRWRTWQAAISFPQPRNIHSLLAVEALPGQVHSNSTPTYGRYWWVQVGTETGGMGSVRSCRWRTDLCKDYCSWLTQRRAVIFVRRISKSRLLQIVNLRKV